MILIKRTLARRDLCNSLIDRRLPALFDGRTGGALKELALSPLTFNARFFVARSPARGRLCAGTMAVPIRRSVAVWWRRLARGRRPSVVGFGRPTLGRGKIRLVVVREVARTMGRRTNIGAYAILVLIARGPRHIVARIAFGRYQIAFVPVAAARPELPLQFVNFTIVKRGSPVTETRACVARLCGAPLRPVGFIGTVVRRPIGPPLGPGRLVIARALAARFVVTITALAAGRIHLPPRIAIAKIFSALSSRKIRASSVIVVAPRSIVVLRLCWVDDSIEPLANGHAGPACGIARRGARVRTGTSQIPWTARFHFHVQSHAERLSAPLIPLIGADVPRTRDAEGALSVLEENVQE